MVQSPPRAPGPFPPNVLAVVHAFKADFCCGFVHFRQRSFKRIRSGGHAQDPAAIRYNRFALPERPGMEHLHTVNAACIG